MLDDVLHLLACPHCAAPLARLERSVACANGHSFDVARSGYLSLLPGDARQGSADTAEMVDAREAFLGAGHFEPLAGAIGDEAERAGLPGGCVVDLGAGTGWYLGRVLDRLPGPAGIALDLSKHALRRAARAHPRIGAVACDAWRGIPVRDSAAALVLSVFAPRNGREIARVLGPSGALVVATPTGRHLGELVSTFGLLTVDKRKQERLGAGLDPHLDLERRVEREWSLALARTDVVNAVAMGPSARHVSVKALDPQIAAMPVTASVTISTYRARPG
ncbi:MAG: putative RNA methyltransferase [Thermoleophilaceae bacterium]